MLNPEELEVQSLYLNLYENPQVAKVLYGFLADSLDTIINELVDGGALEVEPEAIINSLIEYRDGLRQVSAL